MPYLICVRVP